MKVDVNFESLRRCKLMSDVSYRLTGVLHGTEAVNRAGGRVSYFQGGVAHACMCTFYSQGECVVILYRISFADI